MTNFTKVYVENKNNSISDMFVSRGFDIAPSLEVADLVCLEGGVDVTPALYSEENTDSHCNIFSDIRSLGIITAAKLLNIPIVGICRGAQIINVYNGGKMIQHVEGHTKLHKIEVAGEEFEVHCGHHQAMVTSDSVLFSYKAYDGVPEIVSYEGMLGFQPHPEWTPEGSDSRDLFFWLIESNFGIKPVLQ